MRVLLGVARLARGRGDGIALFGATPEAFIRSLLPLLGFSVLGSLMFLAIGSQRDALELFLLSLVAQLAPPVLSHAIATRWGREEDWLRYATAMNWCQVLLPFALLAVLLGVNVGATLGLDVKPVIGLVWLGALGYVLWLSWVVARHGLDLSRTRAAVLVLMVVLGTSLLAQLPGVVAGLSQDPKEEGTTAGAPG